MFHLLGKTATIQLHHEFEKLIQAEGGDTSLTPLGNYRDPSIMQRWRAYELEAAQRDDEQAATAHAKLQELITKRRGTVMGSLTGKGDIDA